MEIYQGMPRTVFEQFKLVDEELQKIKVTIDATLRAFGELRKRIEILEDVLPKEYNLKRGE